MTFGLDFARMRRADSGPALVDPATLPLTMWQDARDFTPTTFPATQLWPGRSSAGPSGARGYTRKAASTSVTANPTASTLGGGAAPAVQFANASGVLVDLSAPTVPLVGSAVFAKTPGWFFHFVGSFVAQSGTNHLLPQPFGPTGGLGVFLVQNGANLVVQVFDGSGFKSVSLPSAAGAHVQVQARHGLTADLLEARIGSGAWVTLAGVSQSGLGLSDAMQIAASQIGYSIPDVGWSGKKQELIAGQYPAGNTTLDALLVRGTATWGAPV